jgi:hypothetical protein
LRAENFDGLKVSIHLLEQVVVDQLQRIDLACWGITGREAVITSAKDRSHSPNSLHYNGLAVDIRTRGISDADQSMLLSYLIASLGRSWDVVLESSHIHIEYDPKQLP